MRTRWLRRRSKRAGRPAPSPPTASGSPLRSRRGPYCPSRARRRCRTRAGRRRSHSPRSTTARRRASTFGETNTRGLTAWEAGLRDDDLLMLSAICGEVVRHEAFRLRRRGRTVADPRRRKRRNRRARVLRLMLPDDAQRDLLVVLRRAPELAQRRSVLHPAVAENVVPPLVKPHAAAHPGVPAHAVTRGPVAVEERSPDRARPRLHEHLDQFHPQHHPPRRDVAAREHLVLVIPPPLVELNHPAILREPVVPRPAVRRDVQRRDLVRIVRDELSKRSVEVAIGHV